MLDSIFVRRIVFKCEVVEALMALLHSWSHRLRPGVCREPGYARAGGGGCEGLYQCWG